MIQFLIRNDDVAFDTTLEEIRQFCQICDKYGYKILHAIIPIGEAKKITSAKLSNDQIKQLSSRLFSENQKVLQFLLGRHDLIGVHGLWHTHKPSLEEIKTAKFILQGLGLSPSYFIPPFNQGHYPAEFANLKTCNLSMKKGQRLEDFLSQGIPTAEIMYLHSWRFTQGWYTFKELENCLQRLKASNH